MRYLKYQIILFVFVVGYFVNGQFFYRKHPKQEVFLFSPWSFFHTVPNHRSEFVVVIDEISGQDVPKTMDLHKERQFFHGSDPIDIFHLVSRWGRSLELDNQDEAARLQRLIEETYLRGSSVTGYRLVKRKYDVLERWKYQRYLEEKEILKVEKK